MKRVACLACLVSLAGSAVVHLALRKQGEASSARVATTETVRTPTSVASVKAAAAEPPVLRQVHEAVERAAPTVTKENLLDYLNGLIERCVAQGQITALESAAGLEMIARVGGDIKTELDFTNTLNDLAQQLGDESLDATPSPELIKRELDGIAQRLSNRQYSNELERQTMIREYIRRTNDLDPEQQIRLVERLNELTRDDERQQPQPRDIDAKWEALNRAGVAEKEGAMRQLLERVRFDDARFPGEVTGATDADELSGAWKKHRGLGLAIVMARVKEPLGYRPPRAGIRDSKVAL